MSQHTKGPWVVTTKDNGQISSVYSPDDNARICTFLGAVPRYQEAHTIAANARLIAAAPELLEALTELLAVVTVRIDDPRTAQFDKARAAIAKATQ